MQHRDGIRWLELTGESAEQVRAVVAKVLAQDARVIAAYHYGSTARGTRGRDIDIGLVVERASRHSFDVEAIASAIAVGTGRPMDDFDVRVVNDADPVFLGNLMREGIRCHQRDENSRVAFEVQAMNAWLDFRPVWERVRERALGTWSGG